MVRPGVSTVRKPALRTRAGLRPEARERRGHEREDEEPDAPRRPGDRRHRARARDPEHRLDPEAETADWAIVT